MIKKLFGKKNAKDPICNMYVDVSNPKYISEVNGDNYYFCSSHCKTEFDKEPTKHLK